MRVAFPQLRNRVRNWEVRGTQYLGEETIWSGQWPFDLSTGRKLHPHEFYANPPATNLRFLSGFNRFELFGEESERIRQQWLAPVDEPHLRRSSELGIALTFPNAGLSDKKPPVGNCLSESEIRRLVRLIKPSQLVLIADRRDHPLLPALVDLSPCVEVCSGWSQLLFLRSFRKLAISQNITHWWGAFLGNASEIYYPPVNRGPWSHPTPAQLVHEPSWYGIDLKVPGDRRYIYEW